MNTYITRLRELYFQQPRREQLLLLVMALCLLAYGLWFGLLQPLQQAADSQRARTEASAATLVRVQNLAAAIYHAQKNQQQVRQQPQVSLADLVDRSLRANGLAMRGFQPSGNDEVKLRLDNANYSNLMNWLHDLEINRAVQIRELSLSLGSGQGLVNVHVRLRKE